MFEFRQKTINGISWSIVSQLGRQGLLLVMGVVLARLLSPREFGLLAMVTAITSLASIFAELGLGAALIQKQEVTQEHLSSVFWLNVGVGILLTMVFSFCAPFIASFYQEPMLVPVTILLSTNFFISSLNIVQNTLLTKVLDFRTLSIVEITAVGVSGTVAIVMAYQGFGVWSLATQSVLLSIVTAGLLWKLNAWRPVLRFNWQATQELLGFSTNLFGTNVLNYWIRNIDYLLIGRFLGSTPLGIYQNAYNVMLFPLSNVSRVLAKVMFPSFSLIQDNITIVRTIYLKITRSIALVTFPMILGLFVTAEPFVLTVFGAKWLAMIPVLRIFCLASLVQSIISLNGNLYLSQGRTDLQFKIGVILRLNLILGIVLGLRWGILGVAIGYTTASLINSYPNFYYAGGLVNLSYWQLVQNLASIFGCAAIMAGLIWGIGLLLPTWPTWLHLLIQVNAGLISYGVLIHLFNLKAYQEVRALIIEQIKLRSRASLT